MLLGEPVELVKITTAGDVDRLHGDKSRWVGALEAALLAGDIDLAVHSAKDVPGEIAAGTEIVATPRRAEPFDALVGDLREGARVGTSALRRRSQLLASHPGVTVVDLRGNVDTRLKKRAAGEVDTLVLAAAGLDRLGRRGEADELLVGGVFVPAPGQGVIAVQGRVGQRGGGGRRGGGPRRGRTRSSTTSATSCARWGRAATRRSACSRSRAACARSSGCRTAPSTSSRRPRAPTSCARCSRGPRLCAPRRARR